MNSAFVALTRADCVRLMATAPVGRIIYTRQAMPAVELVNFTMDAGDIVIRTGASGKLSAAIRGAVVAFEVDDFDVAAQTGWSVTAVGQAREVTDPADISRLRIAGPRPWAPGDRPCFIRITPRIMNGRCVTAADNVPAGQVEGVPLGPA